VAEGIDQRGGAIAVELIGGLAQRLRTGCHRALEHRVHVRQIQMDAHRRAAERLGPAHVHFRVFVGEHDARAADLDLGVADPSARLGQPHHLLGVEHVDVELDRGGCVPDRQIRRHGWGGSGELAFFVFLVFVFLPWPAFLGLLAFGVGALAFLLMADASFRWGGSTLPTTLELRTRGRRRLARSFCDKFAFRLLADPKAHARLGVGQSEFKGRPLRACVALVRHHHRGGEVAGHADRGAAHVEEAVDTLMPIPGGMPTIPRIMITTGSSWLAPAVPMPPRMVMNTTVTRCASVSSTPKTCARNSTVTPSKTPCRSGSPSSPA
jgi:hypothetical protein